MPGVTFFFVFFAYDLAAALPALLYEKCFFPTFGISTPLHYVAQKIPGPLK